MSDEVKWVDSTAHRQQSALVDEMLKGRPRVDETFENVKGTPTTLCLNCGRPSARLTPEEKRKAARALCDLIADYVVARVAVVRLDAHQHDLRLGRPLPQQEAALDGKAWTLVEMLLGVVGEDLGIDGEGDVMTPLPIPLMDFIQDGFNGMAMRMGAKLGAEMAKARDERACPKCGAAIGAYCKSDDGKAMIHIERKGA